MVNLLMLYYFPSRSFFTAVYFFSGTGTTEPSDNTILNLLIDTKFLGFTIYPE